MQNPLPLHPDTCRQLGFRLDGLVDLAAQQMPQDVIEKRRSFLNCSEMPFLMGEPKDVLRLWEEKLGVGKQPDFSSNINMAAGIHMEPFILAWAERELGIEVSRRGERCFAKRRPWLACTLDGFCEYQGGRWVIQTKFYSPWYNLAQANDDRQPQTLAEAHCADADGTLLIIYNQSAQLQVFEHEQDPEKLERLLTAADRFWDAVQKQYRPVHIEAPLAKATAREAVRVGEKSMQGNNAWADAAANWLANQPDKERTERFTGAANALKALVPGDVKRAFGHGIEISVASNGAKTIKPKAITQEQEAA